MTEAMKFWIEEMDIDGYRCDVAGFVPLDFWENVRHELEKIKPVFMLAEWESRDLHKKAFDMTYGWTFWSKMRDVCTRKRTLSELLHYIADLENSFPPDAIKMNFIDNHDKNSWEGTPFTNFGAGLEASMVLAATVPGMPLVYSGQEAGMNKSLSFWDRDPIDWKKHPFTELYKKLFSLKHRNQALWNGLAGGPMDAIVHDKPHQVLAFYREKGNAKVVVLINYSSKAVNSNFQLTAHVGMYKELFSDQIIRLSDSVTFSFKAWEYSVLEKIG
jgi:glycosidase